MSEQMFEVRPVRGGGPPWWKTAIGGAAIAAGAAFALFLQPGVETKVTGPNATPPATPELTPVTLPTGTFLTDRPLVGQCVAITVEAQGALSFPLQWWAAGASGDCTTRTSDIVSTSGRLEDGRVIAFTVGLLSRGAQEATIRFEIEEVGDGISMVGTDPAGNKDQIHFSRVSVVAPSFVPRD